MTPQLILVVDDDEFIREVICAFVNESFGIPTLNATDGEEALTILERVRPSLVIMDVRMPKRGGFEVLAKLNLDEATRTIPVIMLSAAVGPRTRSEALALGADAYLAKPFDFDALETIIRALVPGLGTDES